MSDDSNQPKVGKGFNLVMQLEYPAKLPELMKELEKRKPSIRAALGSLDYVHYARFLPLWQHGLLLIVTEFDGDVGDYVMDFAAVLDEEFSLILSYMKDRPALPVKQHPVEFWRYVERNSRPPDPRIPPYDDPFTPYPDKTALEIVGADRRKALPPPPKLEPANVNLADVQANVLQGYRAQRALHFGLRFSTGKLGRAFVGALSVTAAQPWTGPDHCVNVGFTHLGLQALGLPHYLLNRFPLAFREGPALRASRLGDEGDNAPQRWRIGGVDASGQPADVHAMVSLYAQNDGAMAEPLERLRTLLATYDVGIVFEQAADALDDRGTVHFGYRDGVSQPRIAGVHDPSRAGRQALSPPGDFLLGADYKNARGGNYIGELPRELAENGTYAALRVIEQHVARFETLLDDVARRHGIDRELVAAKLMGRWRDGSPLVVWPDRPALHADHLSSAELDDFDYVARAGSFDDARGARCPVGAHIRRLNPRRGMVVGVPWGRRVIRRGMPYGPAFDPVKRNGHERGLFGLFLCGDLESQFEFLQHVWANKDLSALGLRGTTEPFVGGTGGSTPFRFRPTETSDEITIEVPPLTRTAGSLYLLMPGMSALRWMAKAGWGQTREPVIGSNPKPAAASGAPAAASLKFDPADPEFRSNPYRFYAALRNNKESVPKIEVPYNSHWVLSHALVQEVVDKKEVFLKPGRDPKGQRPFAIAEQFGDGLFFMNPTRHTEVRDMMEGVFKPAIATAGDEARKEADSLLAGPFDKGLDLVSQLARPLPMRVFMKLMGVPDTDRDVVDRWVMAALVAHDEQAYLDVRFAGATATMALRAYFLALAMETAKKRPDEPTVMAGMLKAKMNPHEVMNTAVHFALGGYLSTEFLITTGVYNLLRHPDQWNALRAERGLMPQAIHEMLRYDAPFQMADREVGKEECWLGGVKLDKGAKVTVVYGAANRDDAKFDEPDRFDITRPIDGPHFGFGDGIHRCIGEPLAKTITEVALTALLDRFPSADIDEVGLWTADPYFRSLTKVKLLLH